MEKSTTTNTPAPADLDLSKMNWVTCLCCQGEFDPAEWVMSEKCPECEQPKKGFRHD